MLTDLLTWGGAIAGGAAAAGAVLLAARPSPVELAAAASAELDQGVELDQAPRPPASSTRGAA